MRRNITLKTLLLLSLFVTGSAWAEWKEISESDSATYYMDPSTIRKEGNLRKVWEIYDLKTREKDGTMSIRTRMEYDCKNERSRILASSEHSERMAKGTTTFTRSGEPTGWREIPPGSAIDFVLKIVCAK